MKHRIYFLFCILLSAVICFSACSGSSDIAGDETTEAESFSVTKLGAWELAPGLFIREVFSYSGKYLEDGSNEDCSDICAVILENSSDIHYQYLRFNVKTNGGDYSFSATTLFAGARMTVLCEDRAAFSDSNIISCEALNLAPFAETPSVRLDLFEITYTDGFINVKNISG
nr:hypothetical protein [Clostridia bacterium]